MSNIKERVEQIVMEQLGVDEDQVTSTAHFVDDLGADSLDMTEMVMEFEKEFELDIPEEDTMKVTNVDEAVKYLEGRMAKA